MIAPYTPVARLNGKLHTPIEEARFTLGMARISRYAAVLE